MPGPIAETMEPLNHQPNIKARHRDPKNYQQGAKAKPVKNVGVRYLTPI
jgi:hypothetical protein